MVKTLQSTGEWVVLLSRTGVDANWFDGYRHNLKRARIESRIERPAGEEGRVELRVRAKDLRTAEAVIGRGLSEQRVTRDLGALVDDVLQPVIDDARVWQPRPDSELARCFSGVDSLGDISVPPGTRWYERTFAWLEKQVGRLLWVPGGLLMMAAMTGQLDHYSPGLLLRWILVALPLGLLGEWLLRRVRRRVIRHRAEHATRLAAFVAAGKAHPRFALSLRPFDIDGRLTLRKSDSIWSRTIGAAWGEDSVDLETMLADALWPRLPLVALGRRLELSGAGRIAIRDELWRDLVDRLVSASAVVFMLPSDSTSTLWEICYLRRRELFDKVVLIVPPKENVTQEFYAGRRHMLDEAAFIASGTRDTPVNADLWWAWVRELMLQAGVKINTPELQKWPVLIRLNAEGAPGVEVVTNNTSTKKLRKQLAALGVSAHADLRSTGGNCSH